MFSAGIIVATMIIIMAAMTAPLLKQYREDLGDALREGEDNAHR
ncbi:hypothetical protein ACKC9G_18350 [Pokkaliibacter sp. CJK22405]